MFNIFSQEEKEEAEKGSERFHQDNVKQYCEFCKENTEFLYDRCFPKTRGNIKSILKDLKLDSYDPLQIIEKTKGKTADDNLWLKFKYFPQRRELDAGN